MKFFSLLFKPFLCFWRFCRSRPVKEPYAAAALNTYMTFDEMKALFKDMFKEPSQAKRNARQETVQEVQDDQEDGYTYGSYHNTYFGKARYGQRPFSHRNFYL